MSFSPRETRAGLFSRPLPEESSVLLKARLSVIYGCCLLLPPAVCVRARVRERVCARLTQQAALTDFTLTSVLLSSKLDSSSVSVLTRLLPFHHHLRQGYPRGGTRGRGGGGRGGLPPATPKSVPFEASMSGPSPSLTVVWDTINDQGEFNVIIRLKANNKEEKGGGGLIRGSSCVGASCSCRNISFLFLPTPFPLSAAEAFSGMK